MVPRIQPTSKVALKQQCLMIAEGDIDKAAKLYDYFCSDIQDLPTYDVVPPTTLQQIKIGTKDTMAWLNENKNDILDWVGIIRGIFSKGGGPAEAASPPLPPIN